MTVDRSQALKHSLTQTHAQTLTHSLTLTHSETLRHSHCHPSSHSQSNILTHSQSHTLTLSQSHTLTLSQSHTLTHLQSHTLTLSQSHTLTHNLTHSQSHSLTHNLTHSLSQTVTLSHILSPLSTGKPDDSWQEEDGEDGDSDEDCPGPGLVPAGSLRQVSLVTVRQVRLSLAGVSSQSPSAVTCRAGALRGGSKLVIGKFLDSVLHSVKQSLVVVWCRGREAGDYQTGDGGQTEGNGEPHSTTKDLSPLCW